MLRYRVKVILRRGDTRGRSFRVLAWERAVRVPGQDDVTMSHQTVKPSVCYTVIDIIGGIKVMS